MKYRSFLYALAGLAWALVPFMAQAALVPCGTTSVVGTTGQGSLSCDICSLGELIQNIIRFLIGLSIPLAAALFAWAGILYFISASNPSGIEKARKIFTNVLIGFLIILAAWLVVETLIKAIVKKDYFKEGTWNSLNCSATRPERVKTTQYTIDQYLSTSLPGLSAPSSSSKSNLPKEFCDEFGCYPATNDPVHQGQFCDEYGCYGTSYNHQQGISSLGSNVALKPGASLNGIQTTSVDYVNSVPAQCSCQVYITEGTAGNHSAGTYSHSNGYKLDIRSKDNPTLNNWVTSNGARGSWKDGTPTYTIGNVVWALEAKGTSNEHWDVLIPPNYVIKK